MTNKRGPVKVFTFSFEIDAPNIISCAPKIFSCAPKNVHLVAQVLPKSNLNFEPCARFLSQDIDACKSVTSTLQLKLPTWCRNMFSRLIKQRKRTPAKRTYTSAC